MEQDNNPITNTPLLDTSLQQLTGQTKAQRVAIAGAKKRQVLNPNRLPDQEDFGILFPNATPEQRATYEQGALFQRQNDALQRHANEQNQLRTNLTVSDETLDTASGTAINAGAAFISNVSSLIGATANAIPNAASKLTRLHITPEQEIAFASRLKKEARKAQLTNQLSRAPEGAAQQPNVIKAFADTELTAEEVALDNPSILKGAGIAGSAFETLSLRDSIADNFTQPVKEFFDRPSEQLVNRKDIEESQETLAKASNEDPDSADVFEGAKKISDGDVLVGIGEIMTKTKNLAVALKDEAINSPGAIATIVTESLPQTILSLLNPGVGIPIVAEKLSADSSEEFKREHGREAAGSEVAIIVGTSIASALLDRAGGKAVISTGLAKDLAEATVKENIKKSIPRAAAEKALQTVAKILPTQAVTKAGKGFLEEYVTEYTQSLLEQYGSKQNVDKLDFGQAFAEGGSGGLAGGGIAASTDLVRAASNTVQNLGLGTTTLKKISEASTSAIKNGRAKNLIEQGNVVKTTDPTNSAYDPELAFLIDNNPEVIDKIAEEDLPTHFNKLRKHAEALQVKTIAAIKDIQANGGNAEQAGDLINLANTAQKNIAIVDALESKAAPSTTDTETAITEVLEETSKTPESEAKVTRILGSLDANESVSIQDAKKLIQNPNTTPEAVTQINEYIRSKEAIEQYNEQVPKKIKEVSGDIINGSDGFIGTKQYLTRLVSATKANDNATANTQIQGLKRFVDSRVKKSDDLRTAFDAFSAAPKSNKTKDLIEQFKKDYPTTEFIDNRSRSLVQALLLEKEAVQAQLAKAEGIFNRQFTQSTPVTDPQVSATNLSAGTREDGNTSKANLQKAFDTATTGETKVSTADTIVNSDLFSKDEKGQIQRDLAQFGIDNAVENDVTNSGVIPAREGRRQTNAERKVSTGDNSSLTPSQSLQDAVIIHNDQQAIVNSLEGNAKTKAKKRLNKLKTKVAQAQKVVRDAKAKAALEAKITKTKQAQNVAKESIQSTENEGSQTQVIEPVEELTETQRLALISELEVDLKQPSLFKNIFDNTVGKLSDKFSTRKKTIEGFLDKNPDFMNKLNTDTKFAQSIIKDLSKEESNALRTFAKFHKTFLKTVFNNQKGKVQLINNLRDSGFRDQEVFSLLFKEGVEQSTPENIADFIDPNLVTQMALSSYVWLLDSGNQTINLDDRSINSILGKFADDNVSNSEYALLSDAGTLQVLVEESIGNDALNALGVSPKKTTEGNLSTKLKINIGQIGVAALMEMGLLERNTISDADFNNLYNSTAVNEDGGTADTLPNEQYSVDTNFVRVTTNPNKQTDVWGNQITVPTKQILDLAEVAGFDFKHLSKMFGMDEKGHGIQFSKPTRVSDKVKRSFQNVPKRAAKALLKHTQRPHTSNDNMYALLGSLGTENIGIMAGATLDIDTTQNINTRKTAHAQNAAILNDLEFLQTFKEELSQQENTEFYFSHEMSKNNRINMVGKNTIQGSKIIRHFLGMQKHEIELSTNASNATTKRFLLGAAHALEVSEALSDKGILIKLSEKLNTPVIQAGINALIKAQNKQDITAQEKSDIVNAVQSGGENLASLHALDALANLKSARINNATTFQTNFFREVDGITNGTILSTLQLIPGNIDKVKEMLHRGGIYFKDSKFSNFAEFKASGANDTYQAIAKSWAGKIQNLRNTTENIELKSKIDSLQVIIGSMYDQATDKVEKLGRELAKNPVMIGNYGAGINKIVNEFGVDAVTGIYTRINKIMAISNVSNRTSQLTELGNAIENIVGKSKLSIIRQLVNNPIGFALSPKQISVLEANITSVYGLPLRAAMQEEFGGFDAQRDSINKALNLSFDTFKTLYNLQVKSLEEELGHVLSEEQKQEIVQKLYSTTPYVDSPLAAKGETGTGVVALKTKNQRQHSNKQFVNNAVFGKGKQVAPLRGTEQKPTKSFKSTGSLSEFISGGVNGPVLSIHMIDSAIMLNVLESQDVVNIHDAILTSFADDVQATEAINKALFDLMGSYDLQQKVKESTEQTLKFIERAIKEESTFVQEYNDISQDGISSLSDLVDSVAESITELDNQIKINAPIRAEILSQITNLNQYNNGVAFNPNKIEETKQTEEELIQDNLKQVKAVAVEFNVNAEIDGFIANARFNKDGSLSKTMTAERKQFYAANKEAVDNEIQNRKDINPLGSGPIPINPGTFNPDVTVQVNTPKHTMDIFKELGKSDINGDPKYGNVHEDIDHSAYLEQLLNNLISKNIQPLKLKMKKQGNVTHGALAGDEVFLSFGSGATTNGIQMSGQETYAHEITHAMTEEALDSNFLLRQEVVKLFKWASKPKNGITPESFLNDPSDNTDPIEMEAAQARYDYVFKNTNSQTESIIDPNTGEKHTLSKNAHLHEFLALGITNRNFRAALNNMKRNKPKFLKGDTVFEKLANIFAQLIEYISDLILGTRGASTNRRLEVLAVKLAKADESAKSRVLAKYDFLDYIDKQVAHGLANYVAAPIAKFAQSSFFKGKLEIVQSVGGIIEKTIKNPTTNFFEKWNDVVQDVRRRRGKSSRSLLNSLYIEAIGRTTKTAFWHALGTLSNKLIDQLRKRTTTEIGQMALSRYQSLTTADKTSISKGIIKTDLSVLFDVANDFKTLDKLKEVQKLFESNEIELNKSINEAIKDLDQFGDNKHFYRKHANSLANIMVTGKAVEHGSYMNAHNIANMYNTKGKAIGDIAVAEQIIDKLTTLYAIQKTAPNHNNRIHEIMETEIATGDINNGIAFTLQILAQNKEQSLKQLFNDNKTQFAKGYMKELYDPNITFEIAPLSEQANLRKLGYRRMDQPLGRDSTDLSGLDENSDLYMFVHKNSNVTTRQSGISSITGTESRGSDLIKVATQFGNVDPALEAYTNGNIVNSKKAPLIKKVFSAASTEVLTENLLIPLLSNDGKRAVGHRYIMPEYRKDSVLNRNNSFEQVLGSMVASIDDKVNTDFINNKVVNAAYAEFKEANDVRQFTLISETSDDPAIQEIYRLLPSAMRREIKRVWGQDGMYIQDNNVELVFGRRKFSLADLVRDSVMNKLSKNVLDHFGGVLGQILNFPGLKGAENVWQELVKLVKDTIVIKSGIVLLANIFSNIILLWYSGVPILDIIKNHVIAIKASTDYLKVTRKIRKLETQLRVNPNVNKAKIKIQLAQLNDRVANNPVRELNEAGLYQSIIEDIELEDEAFSYKSKLENWVDPVTRNIPKVIKNITKNVFMTHDTSVYKFMRDATQLSDFVARFVMHEHNIKKATKSVVSNKKRKPTSQELQKIKRLSINNITDLFINYDLPTHKGIQYANDMGLIMFTKFLIRIQKVALITAKNHPGRVFGWAFLQDYLGDTPDIYDTLEFGVLERLNNPAGLPLEIANTPIARLMGDSF